MSFSPASSWRVVLWTSWGWWWADDLSFFIFPSQRDKAQMSAQNVKWPCSSVSHSVSSSVALLFNYWCEQGDKKDRGDRDGARLKDRRPWWDVRWNIMWETEGWKDGSKKTREQGWKKQSWSFLRDNRYFGVKKRKRDPHDQKKRKKESRYCPHSLFCLHLKVVDQL